MLTSRRTIHHRSKIAQRASRRPALLCMKLLVGAVLTSRCREYPGIRMASQTA